ncbi:3-deoxy-manno-octulosonate cytidylyltransferase [Glaciecola siphonariae]|uniref:3-deoxy-manno-octulosonate cytidylyltransferase n=1 Tax=Glaciecola siphonariae TaxID=521012 RepID=A0ABV9LS98_9ALTE
MTDFTVVIPARFASTRFPGKPLALIGGKTMLEHVHQRALEAGASQVIIATDDSRIENAAQQFSADVCMTDDTHQSGTTRIAQVIALRGISDDEIVINVQGDEPFIPPENIRQVALNLAQNPQYPMATLCYPIDNAEDAINPNVVKVVKSDSGSALYFSRAPIPFGRGHIVQDSQGRLTIENWPAKGMLEQTPMYFRHIGIYGYRANFVTRFSEMQDSKLEQFESLEQLRVLERGHRIHIEVATGAPPHGVDTPEDLDRLNEQLNRS